LELDAVHEKGVPGPDDRIPLQKGTDENIPQSCSVVLGERTRESVSQVKAHNGDDEIQTPFPSQQDFPVGLVDQLREADPDV